MTPTSTAVRRAVATAGLLGAAALAACGTVTNSSGQSSTSPPTPASSPSASASPSATPAGVAACPTAGLKAAVDTAKSSGAAGSVYYPVDFTNTSSATCTLYGYPGVSFVAGQAGSQIGSPASRNTSLAATTVTLAPGAVAHATVQVAEAGNFSASQCKPVTAHWLRIYPPGQTTALYTRFTTQVCSGTLPGNVGSQLSVYVIRAGAGTGGTP